MDSSTVLSLLLRQSMSWISDLYFHSFSPLGKLVIWNSLKIHEKNHFSKVSKKSEAVFRPYFRKNMKKVQKTSFSTPKTGILDVLTTKVALLWLVCQKWNPLKTVKTHFFQKFIKNDPFFRKSLKTLNSWFYRYEKWPFGLKSLTCEKL